MRTIELSRQRSDNLLVVIAQGVAKVPDFLDEGA
jgi:hypothetical protein